MKTCSKCGETKPEGEFTEYGELCIECKKEYRRKWRADNPEKIKEYRRKWRINNHEERKECRRKWWSDNPEKMKEYRRKWRAELRDNYVIQKIKQNTSLTTQQIKEFSQLIELQKLIIKTKRL